MNRPNRHWTPKEKLEIIKPIINMEKSLRKVSIELDISTGVLHQWMKAYERNGLEGLNSKIKKSNPITKYSNKKNLTELEKLEYENMKLRIENELLKKGCLMKEDGTIVIFKNKNK